LDNKAEIKCILTIHITDFEGPDFGWFTLCFDVEDMKEAIEYYERLGFHIETGGSEAGWCQMSNVKVRFSIFNNGFIEKEFSVTHLFNFRVGDVGENVRELKERGIPLKKDIEEHKDGCVDALFEDLDGNVFFLDTCPGEVNE
jgi:catechol 2,3-dioxygenase-like lactoylglutathione lyase family enzyme